MLTILSVAIFFATFALSLSVALGYRRILRLEDISPALLTTNTHIPKVSLIVAALNEADTIEPALLSLLAIDYPALEIIVINDRSTDATFEIITRVAAQYPQLKVLHIDKLPDGWLGKNHALFCGAQQASGDYLVFTDADVHFDKTSIARAVHYCEAHQLDHLTLILNLLAKPALLRMMLLSFTFTMLMRFKPWLVAKSRRHFIGMGGFNMVKRSAYQHTGGHKSLATAVIDDVMLGKLIKQQGFKQDVLSAGDLLKIEWYPTAGAMVKGLQKNMFAAFNFQVLLLTAASCSYLLFRLWPWIGLVIVPGASRWLNLLTLIITLASYVDISRHFRWGLTPLFFLPVVSLVEVYIWWRSCLLVLRRGGVEWRGTFYPIRALKQHKLGLW